jgi:hypothetical protein
VKTGALQYVSQADLGAVLVEVNMTGWRIRDKSTGRLCAMSTSLPVDARVQKKGGGALNGCLSETIFAHPRLQGIFIPLYAGRVGGILTACWIEQSIL